MLPVEVETLVGEYLELRTTRDRIQERLDELQKEIIEYMRAAGARVLVHGDRKVTLVSGTRDEVDAEGLYRTLKSRGLLSVARKVFKITVDKQELHRLLDRGLLDRRLVSGFVTVREVAPYLRVDRG